MSEAPGVLRLRAEQRNGKTAVLDIVQTNVLELPGIVTETSLDLPQDMTYDEWEQVGKTLGRQRAAWKWWVGDWLNFGERTYGEMYAQGMEATGLDYGQLNNIAWVARSVSSSRRREQLSWSHHYEVAKLEPDDQEMLLDQALLGEWKRERLREAIKFVKGELPEPVASTDKCGCHCCMTDYCPDCSHPWGQ
jgi:hypothetical protein